MSYPHSKFLALKKGMTSKTKIMDINRLPTPLKRLLNPILNAILLKYAEWGLDSESKFHSVSVLKRDVENMSESIRAGLQRRSE
jgi:hypothetical protein